MGRTWIFKIEIKNISDFRVHSSVDETKKMIEIGLGDGEGEKYTVAVIFKETEEVSGFIRIYDISTKNKICKIRFVVGKKWLNLGKEKLYAEAINNITSYLLENGFDVVSYECNDGSEFYKTNLKILDYTNFRKEAVLHNRIIDENTGEKSNKIIYSIVK